MSFPFRKLTILPALFCLLGGPLTAQDTSPPAAAPAAAPAAGTNGGFITLQNAPVANILDYYEGLSGKRLIRDVNLANAPVVSINTTGMTRDEQLKFIEAALLVDGVGFISIDDKTDKVILLTARTPANEGIKLYANAAELPNQEQVVSYYLPLDYIPPTEAQQIFTQSTPPHQGYGAYTLVPSAQALILTENVSVIRQLIALKELIDVPPARVVAEFVPLSRADAEKVSDLLTKLLDPTAGGAAPSAPGGPGGTAAVPADFGNDEPMLNEHNIISGGIKIVPDPRSNRLLIVTRPVNMPFIKQLIGQLDQTDLAMMPQRRDLHYVLAQDILPALEAALAQGKDEEDQVKQDAKSASSTSAANPGSPGQSTGASSSLNGASTTSGGASLSSITPELSAPPQNNVPTVVTIGKTRILADNRSNSIIVFGSPDIVSRVFDMIDQLDRKPLQVYLATVIGELTVSQGEEFGIDILQKYQKASQGGIASSLITPGSATASAANSTTGTTTGPSVLPDPKTLTANGLFNLAEGLTLYGAIGSTLDAYVRALETTNRFKIISRPSVYTTNNKLAVIASGSQIPIPGTTVSGLNNDNTLTTSSTTTYESVLLELEIIPLINANHEVTLQIRQTNNSQGASQLISGNNIPTILTQEINTSITVRDKQTIVIGGLISDNNNRKESGVPLLSDIPVLGYLFKDTSKSKERDELIIMIQPSVVETDTDQISVNEAEKNRTILGREAVEAATGFSETAPTSALPAPATASTIRTTTTSTYNSKTGNLTKKTVTSSTIATPNPTAKAPPLPSIAPNVSTGHLSPDIPPPPQAPPPPTPNP